MKNFLRRMLWFLKNIQSNAITILHNEKAYLKIEFENFPFLGIWKKENAPFLCIEPWTGYADTTETTGFIPAWYNCKRSI